MNYPHFPAGFAEAMQEAQRPGRSIGEVLQRPGSFKQGKIGSIRGERIVVTTTLVVGGAALMKVVLAGAWVKEEEEAVVPLYAWTYLAEALSIRGMENHGRHDYLLSSPFGCALDWMAGICCKILKPL